MLKHLFRSLVWQLHMKTLIILQNYVLRAFSICSQFFKAQNSKSLNWINNRHELGLSWLKRKNKHLFVLQRGYWSIIVSFIDFETHLSKSGIFTILELWDTIMSFFSKSMLNEFTKSILHSSKNDVLKEKWVNYHFHFSS